MRRYGPTNSEEGMGDLGFEIPKTKAVRDTKLPIDTKYFTLEFKETP